MRNLGSILLIVGAIGVWYFWKKSPDSGKRNVSIGIAIAGFVITTIAMVVNGEFNNSQNSTITTSTTSVTTTTTSTINSDSEVVESSTSSSSDLDDGVKLFDEEANANFAIQLANNINQAFTDNGLDIAVYAEINGKQIVHIIFPQTFKYQSNTDIQMLADATLNIKNATLTQWAFENGYQIPEYTILYINSEDGTELAKEDLSSGTMELKIDNN
ncbi:hypothetical protein [Streptococcus suis]|uniref:hypothetical protein n=1 Tax=Streptococcus suis TaxID=1307 RepID=UPI0037565711